MSYSHFKQPADKRQSSAAPVLARRGERRAFPSPRLTRGSSLTNVRERSAERRWCGTPHPVARPYDRAGPSSGRELPVRDADRRASRRSTAAFSFSLETAFWKRTGAAIRNALDPAGFSPCVHPLPLARCRTDPRSWAGRCLPRPPEIRLRRPNPQAPPLLRQQASPVDALC